MSQQSSKKKVSQTNSWDDLPLFAAAQGAEKSASAPLSPEEELAALIKEVPELKAAVETARRQAEIDQKKADKAAATQDGRVATLRYYERKRIAMTREKSNYSELIFIKAPKEGWYKAFGRSAVYFSEKYAPLVGSKAKLKVDKDYQVKDKIGVVSIPSMELLIEQLKKQKIELIDTKNEIYTFKLPERITADEYNLLKEKSETLFERANTMIRPQVMMPNLMEDAKIAFTTVFWTFKDMHEWMRRMIGYDFVADLKWVVTEYTVLAKTKGGDAEAFLDQALEKVVRAEGEFMALSPLRIVNDEKLYDIASKLSDLRHQIVFEKKKLATKKIDAEHRGRVA